MKRKIDFITGSNNKQIKILYIEDIIANDVDEYFVALESIQNPEWEEFDQIIFKFNDGTSKRIDNK